VAYPPLTMSKLDALRQALDLSPNNVPLLLLFAHAALDEWALDDAKSAFEKALTIESTRPEAQIGIARVLFLAGKASEAAVRAESVIQRHPHFAPAHALLARLELLDGNRESARARYAEALRLDPALRDPGIEAELGSTPAPEPEEPEKVTLGAPSFSSDDDDEESEGTPSSTDVEIPRLSFADVGGMDAVKDEIRMKIILPLQKPELFRAYGKKIGGGVLLYGPPGCGKTLLARATAGEIKASFISIGIHQILDLYLGNSEKNLHALFETARQNKPAVLFFDEVDALAADRNDLKRSAGRTLINQFLAELDGNLGDNDGILILGATNAPWHLDPAFRRPGRFDRILFVPPPDEAARKSIVEVMAAGKPVATLDPAKIAAKTKDFSGADLKAVFDIAIERSLAKAIKEGRVVPLSTSDLIDSAKTVKPSTRAWFESAKNYALYANQGGFYDDVLEYLGIKR
jgi:transitional endoplasmic reticulum ATPase